MYSAPNLRFDAVVSLRLEILTYSKRSETIAGTAVLHRYKYEQKYGMILPGFQLYHKDGNKFNNKLSNLVMLTFQEHIEVHKSMRREMVFKDQLVLM